MFVGCDWAILGEFIPVSPITIEAMREIPNRELIAERIPAADGNRHRSWVVRSLQSACLVIGLI